MLLNFLVTNYWAGSACVSQQAGPNRGRPSTMMFQFRSQRQQGEPASWPPQQSSIYLVHHLTII